VLQACHRANHDIAAFLLDRGKAFDLAEIDEMRRRGQTLLHCRKQCLTAREQLGVIRLAEE